MTNRQLRTSTSTALPPRHGGCIRLAQALLQIACAPPRNIITVLQLRLAEAALYESESLIERARELTSYEHSRGAPRKIYRQIVEARASLRSLEDALRLLERRLTSARNVE